MKPQDLIPVIDIARLAESDGSQGEVAEQIRIACSETGFFYVSNHGIEPALIRAVLANAEAFFALPIAQKRQALASDNPSRRGYEPMREQTLEAGAPPDLKEGFLMGPDVAADDPLVRLDPANHGPNHWPEHPEAFRGTMLAYLAAVQDLAQRILGGLALSLGLPRDYFAEYNTDPAVALRLLHYPPQPGNPAPGEKGCGEHTDWGALTVLLQDAAGGLEVRHQRLGWIKAEPIEGTFVVNLGDLMARWTNGTYRSTLHRVVNYSGRERFSVPFFYIGRSDHRIECIAQCSPDGAASLHAPTTVMGHMEEMVRATFR